MLAQQSDYTATAQKDVVTVSKFLYKSKLKFRVDVCVMIYLKSDGKVALCSKLCVSTVSWLSQCSVCFCSSLVLLCPPILGGAQNPHLPGHYRQSAGGVF